MLEMREGADTAAGDVAAARRATPPKGNGLLQ
jgi:hypothetical protein